MIAFVPILFFLLSYGVLALRGVLQRSDPQFFYLTFHGGLASYSMAFPADGSTRKTAKLTPKVSTKDGSQHILVNPPRVITAVNCTGSCVPMYGKYTRSNSRDPAYLTTVNGRRVL
ncbi:hypothetical protein DER46DRAFT_635204 [Fusarium sp. MPI-SDFR-AT-0072]|nr:hypothetical protein DER46DRAFT_635204 [Fusarium sp. MPI-SDFR-AT-0072]